jgi:putative transcriptional regulator
VRNVLLAFLLACCGAAARAQPTDKPLMLVAAPAMQGLYSHTALIVVPAGKHHLGFIVNRATAVRLAAVLPQHAASAKVLDPVHFGGPDMADTLFAVVRGNPGADALPLFGGLYLASSAAALARVMEQSPADARYFAGFVAWEEGDLQKELSSGNWYVTDADAALFFQRDTSRLWEELVERLGSAQTAAAASSAASLARARSNRSTACMKAGRSAGRREVTRLPSATTALSS